MSYLTTIQIDIFMGLLLLLTLVVAFFKLDRAKAGHGYLVAIIVAVFTLLALEIASVVLDSGFNPSIRDDTKLTPLAGLVNSVGFTLVPIPPFLLLLFMHRWTKVSFDASMVIMCTLIIILNVVLSALSYQHDILFRITEENRYVRGTYFAFSPAAFYFCMILAGSFIIRFRRLLKTEEMGLLGTVILVPALVAGVQLAYGTYLTMWSSWAISSVVLFVGVLVCNAETDELTRLDNRTAFRNAICKAKRMKELKMCVVLLDMDRLKSINDQYGHAAGDRALIALAEGLKKCFGRGFHVMRLGGDEFAVVQFDNDPAPLYHRLCELERILEDHSFTATNPFRVSFSYGLACSRDGEHIDDLLERCDTLMYERKRRKYTARSEGRA